MKKLMSFSFVLALALGLLSSSATLAAPPIPSSSYGTVMVDGANVPEGTSLTAWIDGTQYADTTTQIYQGESVYSIAVPGDDPDTPGVVEGGVPGDTIVFQVDGVAASETGTWQSGNTELNLTATQDGPTPTPTPPPAPGQCVPGQDTEACVTILGVVTGAMDDIPFPDIFLDGEDQIVEVDVGGSIDDSDNVDAGWSFALGVEGPFSDGTGNTIPVGSADQFTVECLDVSGSGDASPICEGLGDIPLDPSNVPMVSADPGTGMGNYDFNARFQLSIPGETIPGTYLATLYPTITMGP